MTCRPLPWSGGGTSGAVGVSGCGGSRGSVGMEDGFQVGSLGSGTGVSGSGSSHGSGTDGSHVPPGWDEWDVPVRRLYEEYGYTLNE
ncbi:hypothetical protein ABT352_39245, partial [Streptosporangium sp. NPDC000563]